MIPLELQILTLLLIIPASAKDHPIVACFKHHYLLDGGCYPCPLNCETCASETECSECRRGFFGSACEHTCVTWCDSECHQVYGHCRYGCWDGTYSTKNDSLCRQCPDQCTVCESSTHCSACSEGWYGRICQQACPKHCSRCDKSSGKCWQCQDSYYLQYGHCKPCPHGCTSCVSGTNCTQCQFGVYGPVCENPCKGECTKKCHKVYGNCTYSCPGGEYGTEKNACIICPDMCRLCESKTKCVLCKDKHFGETCQEKCPDHCILCTQKLGNCLQCENPYFPFDGKCKRCSSFKNVDAIYSCQEEDLPDNSTDKIWQQFLLFFSSAVIICIITVLYLRKAT